METGRNIEPAFDLAKQERVMGRDTMQREVEDLRKDVDRLLLINEALWRIVKTKLDCTDAELVQGIHEIDLEDGHLDGRKGPTAQRNCPNCERPLGKHKSVCVYCGVPVEFVPFER